MENFIFSLNATIPVFAIIVVGNILRKIGIIDLNFSNIANKFVFKICLPCLLLSGSMFQPISVKTLTQNTLASAFSQHSYPL